MAHSYKTILKKIILKLGFGFKKDRIEACLGEEIPLELDEELFKGNVKTAKKTTKKNSFARWFTGDGSKITDSKTVQDDVGNTVTRASVNGTLHTIIANDTGATVHSLEATIGRPIYRMLIPGKQLVDTYISQKDYSYNIFLNDIKSEKNRGELLTMLPNGIILGKNQPKASGRLIKSTGRFPKKTWLQLGQRSGFQKFRDEDGFNKSSNNFYPGDGNQRGAYYTFPYAGVWAVQFQYILDQGGSIPGTRVLTRITWGKSGNYKSLRITTQMAAQYQQFGDCKLLPFEKGDTCFIEVNVDVDDERVNPFIYAEDNIRNIDNYLGFFLVIG